MIRRRHYQVRRWIGTGIYEGEPREDRWSVEPEDADVVSSELEELDTVWGDWVLNGLHSPALDLDFPQAVETFAALIDAGLLKGHLVQSSTPGHAHYYAESLMPWPAYARLLTALDEAGVLEKGYVEASLRRKATFLRPPGVRKGEEPKGAAGRVPLSVDEERAGRVLKRCGEGIV